MRNILGVFGLLLLLFDYTNIYADDIQFSLQLDFTVPGLDGPIQSIKFNDIDHDGFPEVLATDGNKLILYSIKMDSILFSVYADSGFKYARILFEDVTRDSTPDIIAGSEKPLPLYSYPEGDSLKIDLFNGANAFSRTTKYLSESDIGAISLYDIRFLETLDADMDGYNELLVSYDGYFEDMLYGVWLYSYSCGGVFLYRQFPDSVIWHTDVDATNMNHFKMGSDSMAIWLNTYYSSFQEITGPDTYYTQASIVSLSYDGQIKSVVGNAGAGCRNDYVNDNSNYNVFRCAGDLNTANPGIEAATIFEHYDQCYPDTQFTYYTYFMMYAVIRPDSVKLLWKRDIGDLYLNNFLYDPRFPGYFMAFGGSILNLIQGNDGKIRYSTAAPSGSKLWTYPFADSVPRLITLRDRAVSIYKLDITVGYNDQTNEILLPQEFYLDQNYPNPFNSATRIGFSLPKASLVTIDLFNIMGQKIRTLINKKFAAGTL